MCLALAVCSVRLNWVLWLLAELGVVVTDRELSAVGSRAPGAIFSEVDALEEVTSRTDEAVRLYNRIQQCAILGDEEAMCAEMAAFCKVSGGPRSVSRQKYLRYEPRR